MRKIRQIERINITQ